MKKNKKSSLSLLIMLAVIVVLIVVIFFLPSCGSQKGDTTLVKVGEQAPDFTVEMVDGSRTSLSEYRGRVVLLNFWATWCPPCRAELKGVQTDLIDRFAGENFTFLPISRGEDRETVEVFRQKNGYTFAMGLDPQEEIYNKYANNYIPRNFLIDKQGNIIHLSIGYTPAEFDELVRMIKSELQKQ